MIKISGIQAVSNGIFLGYPFIEAILSVLPVVDEFLINDGGSEDETSFYLKKLKRAFPEKIRLFNKPYYPSDYWETIDETIEFLIKRAKGDWLFEVQADESWHEKDIFKVKKIIKEINKKDYNSLRAVCHWFDFQNINSYKYRNVRIIRKIKNLKSHWGGDDFQIGDSRMPAEGFTSSNVPPESLRDDLYFFNLSCRGFPLNALERARAVSTFIARKDKERQRAFQNELGSSFFRKTEPDLETVKQLPALVRGLAGLDSYRVREELFDKKWLTRLAGLNYLQL